MPASTTAEQLRRCLDAVAFPASKDDLLTAANRLDCDADTIAALQAIHPQTYTNSRQVAASLTLRDNDTSQNPADPVPDN
ncbi:DUF2795 domain-containing protein [Mycobacterium colombiense]|nr:DUF2795 domain-containing protein [Mycobacterium colombiense]